MLIGLRGLILSAYRYVRIYRTYTWNLALSPWKCAGGDILDTPRLSCSASSFAVFAVLPDSVGIRLTALSFPEGAIMIYPVLFLTLERGWSKCNKPCWLA
jgi:hypothetical protein